MDLIKKGELLNTSQIERRLGADVNRLRIVPFETRGLLVFDIKRGKLYVMEYTNNVINYRRQYRCVTNCSINILFDFLAKAALAKY
jgi:hypothetical protein